MNNNIKESLVLLHDDFLSEQANASLVYLAEKLRPKFEEAPIFQDDKTNFIDKNYRNSYLIFDQSELEIMLCLFKFKLMQLSQELKENFDYDIHINSPLKCQISACNDGHFLKPHNDVYGGNIEQKVSAVYYFYRQPKAFDGGQIYIWDQYENAKPPYDEVPSQGGLIEPLNNRLIVFDSKCLHEVLEVKCPSKDFMDSRFTVTLAMF